MIFYLLDCCHLVVKNYAIPLPPSYSTMKLELRCLQCKMHHSACALLHRLFCKLNMLKFPQLRYSSGHKKLYVFDYAVAIVRSAIRMVRYHRRTV